MISVTQHPTRIPGYDGGPLTYRPELLSEHLFWLGHIVSCVQGEESEELLFGADHDAASEFHRQLWERADWPTFTIPLADDHRLHVVYRTLADDKGTDYLLHHPDWEQAESLAHDDGHFMGPALSWPELAAAADNTAGNAQALDPHTRLLLLLPSFGDDAVPDDAKDRLTAALQARTAVDAPDELAAAILEDQGQTGQVHWTTTKDGLRINDGGYCFRNPANHFALSADRLARVNAALTP